MEALLHEGPLTINQIGQKVLLTSGSMTAAVNHLELKGLVKRISDPSDGRCFYVRLTKKGRKVINEAFHRHQQNLEKIAEALTTDERVEFARLLKKLGFHAERTKAG